MDGVLDESIWKQVVPLTGFIDERTKGPADQQTKVYLAYTQTHLYIAVECLEDRMDRLVASEQREDRFFRGDD
ncbi:MAG: DOMON domain-containing protein, partial [Planctomycetota bacterium]